MPGIDQQLLIVFDFDHTLIDANSDLVPFKSLSCGQPLLPRFASLRKDRGLGWTQIMQTQLAELARQEGYSKADLLACLHKVKMDPVLSRALKAVGQSQNPKAKAIIASDANTIFIEEILAANGLEKDTFAAIYTNPATWSAADELQLEPYQPVFIPHQCPRKCPANMCKTTILRRALKDLHLEDAQKPRMVYVGDGGNDFCPSMSLTAHDLVLARDGFALQKLIDKAVQDDEVVEVLNGQVEHTAQAKGAETSVTASSDTSAGSGQPRKVSAQVRAWQSHEELGHILLGLVGGALPGTESVPTSGELAKEVDDLERVFAQTTIGKGSRI